MWMSRSLAFNSSLRKQITIPFCMSYAYINTAQTPRIGATEPGHLLLVQLSEVQKANLHRSTLVTYSEFLARQVQRQTNLGFFSWWWWRVYQRKAFEYHGLSWKLVFSLQYEMFWREPMLSTCKNRNKQWRPTKQTKMNMDSLRYIQNCNTWVFSQLPGTNVPCACDLIPFMLWATWAVAVVTYQTLRIHGSCWDGWLAGPGTVLEPLWGQRCNRFDLTDVEIKCRECFLRSQGLFGEI